MKKNGFTLVEILAVIVIIALLMVLTIPNILKISRSTKERAYETKIDLIEQSAISFGMDNRNYIMQGVNPYLTSGNGSSVATAQYYTITEDPKTGEVQSLQEHTSAYSAGESLPAGAYRGIKLTVDQLVGSKDLNWDNEKACESCNDSLKPYYNNTIINPTNNYIINKCFVYIYYKYSRPYAYFDRTTCDISLANPSAANGNQYAPIKK